MIQFKLARGKNDLISTGGNFLCGLIFQSLVTFNFFSNFQKRRRDAISDHDILMTMTGLLCNGRTDFNDVELYRKDELFLNAFGLEKLPSEAVLRNRLDEMPPDATHQALNDLNLALLKNRTLSPIQVDDFCLIPVDIDVSPFDNSDSCKQGVSRTYKGHDGFAPIFAYAGQEGYMIDCQLRPGKQHCQAETAGFIEQVAGRMDGLGYAGKGLFRLDAGNDAQENFESFGDHYFIVKRNQRKESPEQWLKLAKSLGEVEEETREGKRMYRGFVDHLHPGGNEEGPAVSVCFEVIERVIDAAGHKLLWPEIEVNTFWTNLPCPARQIVELYHGHGTSEQFHSELKSDLDLERLPSGKFCVNKIILRCGMLAYNALRALGQEALKHAESLPVKVQVKRWRIKTVLQNLIYSAVKMVRHARGIKLQLGCHNPWYGLWQKLSHSLG